MEQRIKKPEESLRIVQRELEELQRAFYLCQEGRKAWVSVQSEYKGVSEDVRVLLSKKDLQQLIKNRRKFEKKSKSRLKIPINGRGRRFLCFNFHAVVVEWKTQ